MFVQANSNYSLRDNTITNTILPDADRGVVHDIWLDDDGLVAEHVFRAICRRARGRLIALHIAWELSSKEQVLSIGTITTRLRLAGFVPLLGAASAKNKALLHIFGVLKTFENTQHTRATRDKWRWCSRIWPRLGASSQKCPEMIRTSPVLIARET